MSLEAWIRADSNAGTQVVFYHGYSSTTGYGLMIQNGVLKVLCGGVRVLSSRKALSLHLWQQVAIVRRRGLWNLYVDGVAHSLSYSSTTPRRPVWQMTIGADHKVTNNFRGSVDEFRAWNVACSASQISATRTRSLAPNEPGLAAYWRLDEGTGLRVTDSTGGQVAGLDSATWMNSEAGLTSPTPPYFWLAGSTPPRGGYVAGSIGYKNAWLPSIVSGGLNYAQGEMRVCMHRGHVVWLDPSRFLVKSSLPCYGGLDTSIARRETSSVLKGTATRVVASPPPARATLPGTREIVCRAKGRYSRPWVGAWDPARKCVSFYSSSEVIATTDIEFLVPTSSSSVSWIRAKDQAKMQNVYVCVCRARNARGCGWASTSSLVVVSARAPPVVASSWPTVVSSSSVLARRHLGCPPSGGRPGRSYPLRL